MIIFYYNFSGATSVATSVVNLGRNSACMNDGRWCLNQLGGLGGNSPFCDFGPSKHLKIVFLVLQKTPVKGKFILATNTENKVITLAISLKGSKMELNWLPLLEKILNFTCIKFLRMPSNFLLWLEKYSTLFTTIPYITARQTLNFQD